MKMSKILELPGRRSSMPELDYVKLAQVEITAERTEEIFTKEAFSLREINQDVVNAFLDKQEAHGGRKDGGVRQWNSDGNSLYYYNSKVAWHNDDGGITLSDAGWKTQTTSTLIDGVIALMRSRGLTNLNGIRKEKGDWYLTDSEGKIYPWNGQVEIKSDGTIDQESTSSDEFEESVKEKSRSISSQVRKDVNAIMSKILEEKEFGVSLDILDENVYGEEIAEMNLPDFLYEYYERKGYGNPGYIMRGMERVVEPPREVQEITNIASEGGDNISVSYSYEGRGGTDEATEVFQLDPGTSVDDLKRIIGEKERLKEDTIKEIKLETKKALREHIKRKMYEEQSGKEYEVIR